MNLTTDQIARVEELAAIFLPISDIALDIRVPASELRQAIANEDSPASIAYRRGKLQTRIEIHRQEVELAKVGSPSSLETIRHSLIEMEDDEL